MKQKVADLLGSDLDWALAMSIEGVSLREIQHEFETIFDEQDVLKAEVARLTKLAQDFASRPAMPMHHKPGTEVFVRHGGGVTKGKVLQAVIRVVGSDYVTVEYVVEGLGSTQYPWGNVFLKAEEAFK